MKFKHIALVALVIQGSLLSPTWASSRDEEDVIFSEPAQNGGTQILLGLAEFINAQVLEESAFKKKELSPAAKEALDSANNAVRDAEERLNQAKRLILTEEEQALKLKLIVKEPEIYVQKYGPFKRDLMYEEILEVRSAKIMSRAEKQAQLSLLEEHVTLAREKTVQLLQKEGLLSRSVRVLRYGTALLLYADVVARFYVWFALDADPTLTPAGTYLQHLIKD